METRDRTEKMNTRTRTLLRTVTIFMVSLLVVIAVFRGVFVLYYHEFFATAYREYRIPGLSDHFVPQGMAAIGSGDFLISGYMSDTSAARIYYINAHGSARALRVTWEDGTTLASHAGGIACGGEHTYLVGGGNCYVLETRDLTDPTAHTVKIKQRFETENRASFCDIQGGCLLVGEYAYGTRFQTDASHRIVTPSGDRNTALVMAFALDAREPYGVRETPVAAYSIPERVQGMCYTDDGRMILSASSAFGASQLYLYDYCAVAKSPRGIRWENGTAISLYYLDSENCTGIIPMPPYSEETVFTAGKLYILFESASSRFQFGRLVGGDYVYSMALPDWTPLKNNHSGQKTDGADRLRLYTYSVK